MPVVQSICVVASVAVFTPETRTALRDELIAAAEADERVVAAALTGSAASGKEDRWSDTDLAMAVADGIDRDAVLTDWTTRMYAEHGTVDPAYRMLTDAAWTTSRRRRGRPQCLPRASNPTSCARPSGR